MVKSPISFKRILLGLSFSLGAGCSQDPIPEETKCGSPYLTIISTILNDAELINYASSHFESNKKLIVIWDDAPTNVSPCVIGHQEFTVAKSSVLYDGKVTRYVVVTKMYYDDSAAFVEMMLFPNEKNGDFFLRNMGEWKVVQKKLWEIKNGSESNVGRTRRADDHLDW